MKTTLENIRELAALIDFSADDKKELEERLLCLSGKVCRAIDAGQITISDPEAELAIKFLIGTVVSHTLSVPFCVQHVKHDTLQ